MAEDAVWCELKHRIEHHVQQAKSSARFARDQKQTIAEFDSTDIILLTTFQSVASSPLARFFEWWTFEATTPQYCDLADVIFCRAVGVLLNVSRCAETDLDTLSQLEAFIWRYINDHPEDDEDTGALKLTRAALP